MAGRAAGSHVELFVFTTHHLRCCFFLAHIAVTASEYGLNIVLYSDFRCLEW